ncbi:MAG: hypothetical protein LZ168_04450 [Thaumarchaeota archaeon]|jgi:hypothetical protein|nr:hypothetical protein [Candidatus Geocrenenecus arthurdayi]
MSWRTFETILFIEPLIIKEDIEEDEFIGFFEGIASTPDVDLEGDKILPEVLVKNVDNLKGKPILLLHGRESSIGARPVGRIIDAWVEDNTLKIKAGIYRAFSKIWDYIKKGVLKALSIGGVVRKLKRDGSINVIEDAEIREVSLTPRGVNPSAKIIKILGKSYNVSDGFLREITSSSLEEYMIESTQFEKVDYSLDIVERSEWDGREAARRILDWAEREDGTIDREKASKLFLVVEGEGKNRSDYSWPVGDIIDGKPVLVTSGIITAIKYASGARGVQPPPGVKKALERLVERMIKEGFLPRDYIVPWRRSEKSLETCYIGVVDVKVIEDLEERLEKLESYVLSKSIQVNSQNVEKGMVLNDELVSKNSSVGHRLDKASMLVKLYREIYGGFSD